MKILIDINHPAHVHYFRNFIKIMEDRGHKFKVINRDSPTINALLDYYGIEHVIRNPRPKKKGQIASMINLGKMVMACIVNSLKFRPDLYLGFGSSACAITSALFRRPSILIDDTEINGTNHAIYRRFCSCVLTPFYFKKKLGDKQIYYDAFVEQFYLNPKYFKPNSKVLERLGLKKGEYVLVRYISYDAHHDLKVNPVPEEDKMALVKDLAKRRKVFVSHESAINDYGDYKLDISPEEMHDVMAGAKYVITEGATMASEAFFLGVPYVYLNPLKTGYVELQAKTYPDVAVDSTDISEIKSAINDFETKDQSSELGRIKQEVEQQTINPTDMLVWFVENYPKSEKILRTDPEFVKKSFPNN